MVGWHHQLSGQEFEQPLGVDSGQGSLVCCSPWGCQRRKVACSGSNHLGNRIRDGSLVPSLYSIPFWLLWLLDRLQCPSLPQEFLYQGISHFFISQQIFQVSDGKETTCQCRRYRRPRFDPWVGKIPWRRKWQPIPVFLPGEFHIADRAAQ